MKRAVSIGVQGGFEKGMEVVMKIFYSIASVTVIAVLLAGCMSPVGPNQATGTAVGAATGAIIGGSLRNDPGDALIGGVIGALIGALAGKDVDDVTRQHVSQGQPLTLEDVKELAKAKVGDDLIISQIKSTRTVYRLSSAQIIELKNAGVSQKVLDYMINTTTTTQGSAQTSGPVVVPVPVPEILVPLPGPPPPPPPPPHHHWR